MSIITLHKRTILKPHAPASRNGNRFTRRLALHFMKKCSFPQSPFSTQVAEVKLISTTSRVVTR